MAERSEVYAMSVYAMRGGGSVVEAGAEMCETTVISGEGQMLRESHRASKCINRA